jgi:hypothetical protein
MEAYGIFPREGNASQKTSRRVSNGASRGRKASTSLHAPQEIIQGSGDVEDHHTDGRFVVVCVVENLAKEVCIAKMDSENVCSLLCFMESSPR